MRFLVSLVSSLCHDMPGVYPLRSQPSKVSTSIDKVRRFGGFVIMNTVSRITAGTIAIALGLFIIYATIIEGSAGWSLLWGVLSSGFIAGIGIYLFLNKKEDDIEEIKSDKE